MSDWALVLGASSGFGAATARELARAGYNIAGVHMDRRETMPLAQQVIDDIRALNREALFFNANAADAEQRAAMTARYPVEAAAFLASAGPHHVLEVDSSWGAGSEGSAYGGYRRDTWIYDASTKKWGSFDPRTTPPSFQISARGPSGDAYHATYRPR